MKIHRFYIENIDISPENTIVTQETSLIHQLKNVFRYKKGQKINIFNEKMGEMEVELLNIGKKDMSFKYNRHIKHVDNSKGHIKQVNLYMSIIKNSNFDIIVEKAVELGIDKIIPVITERTIKNNLNFDRLSKIIKEATEQSGRIDLMKMSKVIDFEESIKMSKSESDIVFFGSTDENIVKKYIQINKMDNVSIFIGPEGGFSDREIGLLNQYQIKPVRLGDYVLRAETAAIVACGLFVL